MESEETVDVREQSLPMPSLTGHMWRQYGNRLECQSCKNHHSAFLQLGYYLSGYKDGIPVISPIATRYSVPPQGSASESVSS